VSPRVPASVESIMVKVGAARADQTTQVHLSPTKKPVAPVRGMT